MATYRSFYRVLVADDDPSTRRLLGALLSQRGHVVIPARNGREATRKLMEGTYALAIVDYEMPFRTGTEVIRHLRSEGRDFPVLLISGSSADRVLGKSGLPSHTGFLPKPFSCQELLTAIGEFLPAQKA